MRKAIGYIRVSTGKQRDDGVSLDAQREKIVAYCVANDYELVAIHADEGISGKRERNRPQLRQAMKAACHTKAVLVCYSLSRFARNTRECLALSEQITACGAQLAFITQKIDTTTPHGRLYFTISAAIAELESAEISERTLLAMDYKRSRGERLGTVPFGYSVGEDGVKLVEEPSEQATLRMMRTMRKDGVSYAKIATTLNTSNVPAKGGGLWYVKTVFGVLTRTA